MRLANRQPSVILIVAKDSYDASRNVSAAKFLPQAAHFKIVILVACWPHSTMSSTVVPSLPQEAPPYSPSVPYFGGEPVEEYPDRVFVGGFSENINEDDLSKFFEKWVQVREAKILREEGKRGFGFLTLSSEHDALFLKQLGPENLVFHGQRLNIGPARKKIATMPRKSYYGDGFAVVTPDGYHSPGSYTFCLDKAPHFLPRSPSTKAVIPPDPYVIMHTVGQSASAQSISSVTSEHEVQSINEEKLGIREANNNISHLLPPNARLDTFYPFFPYYLPIQFINPSFQVPLQQPRVYPMYKELHEGTNFKPYFAS